MPLQSYQVGQLVRKIFPNIGRCKVSLNGRRLWVYRNLAKVLPPQLAEKVLALSQLNYHKQHQQQQQQQQQNQENQNNNNNNAGILKIENDQTNKNSTNNAINITPEQNQHHSENLQNNNLKTSSNNQQNNNNNSRLQYSVLTVLPDNEMGDEVYSTHV